MKNLFTQCFKNWFKALAYQVRQNRKAKRRSGGPFKGHQTDNTVGTAKCHRNREIKQNGKCETGQWVITAWFYLNRVVGVKKEKRKLGCDLTGFFMEPLGECGPWVRLPPSPPHKTCNCTVTLSKSEVILPFWLGLFHFHRRPQIQPLGLFAFIWQMS